MVCHIILYLNLKEISILARNFGRDSIESPELLLWKILAAVSRDIILSRVADTFDVFYYNTV